MWISSKISLVSKGNSVWLFVMLYCMSTLTGLAFAQRQLAPLPTLQNQEPGVSRMARQGIVFTEPASGGFLCLAGVLGGNSPGRVLVETIPGESPESVAAKLAGACGASEDFPGRSGGINADANGIICVGIQNDGSFCFGGTETGLGIPEAVKGLSASYDAASDTMSIVWKKNSDNTYRSFAFTMDGRYMTPISGDKERYEWKNFSEILARSNDMFSLEKLNIGLIAYTDFCPSAAAQIRLTPCRIEELADLPFRLGIAPNWSEWQAPETRNIAFEEGHKQFFIGVDPETLDVRQQKMQRGDSYNFTAPEEKRLYQILRATGGDSSGGVYRYFLGLQPGHVYRVRMRVNTLDQRADAGQWSYSLYALPVSSSAGEPSSAQLAGTAPFASGATAGQAALFTRLGSGGGGDTQGEWRYVATDGNGPGATGRGNIVLPAGADSILVWVTYTSDIPGAVGFDWIALEDADCMEALQ